MLVVRRGAVWVFMFGDLARKHDRHPVLYAPDTSQMVGQVPYLPNAPRDDQDLQASLEVQMYVDGRGDELVMFMLDIGQLFVHIPFMMVVEKSDGPADPG